MIRAFGAHSQKVTFYCRGLVFARLSPPARFAALAVTPYGDCLDPEQDAQSIMQVSADIRRWDLLIFNFYMLPKNVVVGLCWPDSHEPLPGSDERRLE